MVASVIKSRHVAFGTHEPDGPASARVVVRPELGPPEGIDVTDAVVRAVARELTERLGGNEALNTLEAERLVLRWRARVRA